MRDQLAEYLKLGLDFRLLGGRTAQCREAGRLDFDADPEFQFLDDVRDLVRRLGEQLDAFRRLPRPEDEDADTVA